MGREVVECGSPHPPTNPTTSLMLRVAVTQIHSFEITQSLTLFTATRVNKRRCDPSRGRRPSPTHALIISTPNIPHTPSTDSQAATKQREWSAQLVQYIIMMIQDHTHHQRTIQGGREGGQRDPHNDRKWSGRKSITRSQTSLLPPRTPPLFKSKHSHCTWVGDAV